jgi:flagellum-specific peptidoglycan hydrolase FlgJ
MTKNEFLETVAKLVVEENNRRGKPLFASVVIAQAICESRLGTKSNYDESKCNFWNKSNIKLERKSIQ